MSKASTSKVLKTHSLKMSPCSTYKHFSLLVPFERIVELLVFVVTTKFSAKQIAIKLINC